MLEGGGCREEGDKGDNKIGKRKKENAFIKWNSKTRKGIAQKQKESLD